MWPEHELWAVALWIEQHHGANGPRFIAEQIGRLVLVGDDGGVQRWRQIAERYGTLLSDKGVNAPN